jgi:hypothetical protein
LPILLARLSAIHAARLVLVAPLVLYDSRLGEPHPRRLELEWSILDEFWGFILSIVVLLLVYTEMMYLRRLLQLDANLEQGVFVVLHTNNASAIAKFGLKSSLLVANKQSSKREKKSIHAKTVVQSMFVLRGTNIHLLTALDWAPRRRGLGYSILSVVCKLCFYGLHYQGLGILLNF